MQETKSKPGPKLGPKKKAVLVRLTEDVAAGSSNLANAIAESLPVTLGRSIEALVTLGSSYIVYRLYDSDGDLLYIGMSSNIAQRILSHRSQRSWWSDVETITMTRYDTRKLAAAAELAAIRSENPLYNVSDTGGAPRGLRGPEKRQVLLRFEIPIHDELSRKAGVRGKSLPEYLQDFITTHAVTSSKNVSTRVGTLEREATPNFKAGKK